MSDQYQQVHNMDQESMDITHGYDMEGHAHLASVLQVILIKLMVDSPAYHAISISI